MKNFHTYGGYKVWFHNSKLTATGQEIGYLPAKDEMLILLEPAFDREPVNAVDPRSNRVSVRKCRNYWKYDVCNWLIPSEENQEFCLACRLNYTIPDLDVPGNFSRWYRLEIAKRKMIYGLISLGLPIIPKAENSEKGFGFSFMADLPPGVPMETLGEDKRVVTGHANGMITINLAEADDVWREKTKVEMQESYRTLLGHFRHEIGHYYWDLLIRNSRWLSQFEEIFGDWKKDYAQALGTHYTKGPGRNWSDEYISDYATAHPWEDWAETWAHYMLMTGTIETAFEHQMMNSLELSHEHAEYWRSSEKLDFFDLSFDLIFDTWLKLTALLNDLNLSMGYDFAYPFSLTEPVKKKISFVHDLIRSEKGGEPVKQPPLS